MSVSYHRLSIAEREEMSLQLAIGSSYRAIAQQLSRCPSTLSREVARNRSTLGYRAVTAQQKAAWRCYRKPRKLAASPRLRQYMPEGLRKQWSPQ